MRNFLNPFACGDGDGCGCGGTFEIVKNEPDSGDDAGDDDCGDDCACHDTESADCGCESDNNSCCC